MDYSSPSALRLATNLVASSWGYLLSIHNCLLDFLESWGTSWQTEPSKICKELPIELLYMILFILINDVVQFNNSFHAVVLNINYLFLGSLKRPTSCSVR